MNEQTRVTLNQSILNQLNVAKQDYRDGLITKDTLQYVAKSLQHIQLQINIEATKTNYSN